MKNTYPSLLIFTFYKKFTLALCATGTLLIGPLECMKRKETPSSDSDSDVEITGQLKKHPIIDLTIDQYEPPKISPEDKKFLDENIYYAEYKGEILFQNTGTICGHISTYTTCQTDNLLKNLSSNDFNIDEVIELLPSRNVTPDGLDEFINQFIPQECNNQESSTDEEDKPLSAFGIMDILKKVDNDSLLNKSVILALDENNSYADTFIYKDRLFKLDEKCILQCILNSYGYLSIILKPRIWHWISVLVIKNSDNTPFFIVSDSMKKEHAQQCEKTQASLIHLKKLLTQK